MFDGYHPLLSLSETLIVENSFLYSHGTLGKMDVVEKRLNRIKKEPVFKFIKL